MESILVSFFLQYFIDLQFDLNIVVAILTDEDYDR